MAGATPPIQLLLIDDDEDAYLIVRHLLGRVRADDRRYVLEWCDSYQAGLEAIEREAHDLYLIDYHLRESEDGLNLLRAARERGHHRPMVLLTGRGDREIDLQAMNAGAADYLVKDEITSSMLDRTIRYALEHYRLLEEHDRQARKLRMLAGELGRAEERERRRIALLLHDELQQTLVAARLRVSNVHHQLTGAAATELATGLNLLDELLAACRDLTIAISPPVLHSAGLLAACHWLGGWIRQHYGLHVELDLHEDAEPQDEHVRIFLFHAIRELLLNVVKHAHADRARLVITRTDHQQQGIDVRIEDDGVGFDLTSFAEDDDSLVHFGLFGIRQRVELKGGRMTIDTAPGQGTRVNLHVPALGNERAATRTPASQPRGENHPGDRSGNL